LGWQLGFNQHLLGIVKLSKSRFLTKHQEHSVSHKNKTRMKFCFFQRSPGYPFLEVTALLEGCYQISGENIYDYLRGWGLIISLVSTVRLPRSEGSESPEGGF
jgi:hypothetical protein